MQGLVNEALLSPRGMSNSFHAFVGRDLIKEWKGGCYGKGGALQYPTYYLGHGYM